MYRWGMEQLIQTYLIQRYKNKEIAMLRSHQEEQIKYFYLDRKFGSGSLREIGDALDEIDLFLGRMKKIDLINSLVMRMLDLIQTAKSFHIKQRVSSIFRHHSAVLLDIHSRDEIAAVLSKCLKGSDQYTRIIAMQMVTTLTSLFLKDIAVYHTLLSKISSSNHLSKSEKKEAIVCLTHLLATSRQLSKLFSRNITEIQQQYQIHLHVIIYLLTYVTIDSHLQKQILEEVLVLITNSSEGKSKESKKQIYYYEKLVMNYATCNYRIIQLYESKLQYILPRIQGAICKIKSKKYPFMKNANEISSETGSRKVEEFIEDLYERKRQGNMLVEYQLQIRTDLMQAVAYPHMLEKSLLLVYFIEGDTLRIDEQILALLERNQSYNSKILFKQLLLVGLFQSSRVLLDRTQLFQSNYVFLKLYVQFKLADTAQSLLELIEIISILDEGLCALLTMWYKVSQIFQGRQSDLRNESILSSLYADVNECQQTLKRSCKFALKQQLQVISIILHNKSSNLHELKSKCYYILPSSILHHSRFWFAYLNKKTILSLFHTLL